MRYAAFLIGLQFVLLSWACAADRAFTVLAEKPLEGGHTLCVLRGPDIDAAKLSGVPFLAERVASAVELFELRVEIRSPDGEVAPMMSTLWPGKTKSSGYSGFEVLALDCDRRGVILDRKTGLRQEKLARGGSDVADHD